MRVATTPRRYTIISISSSMRRDGTKPRRRYVSHSSDSLVCKPLPTCKDSPQPSKHSSEDPACLRSSTSKNVVRTMSFVSCFFFFRVFKGYSFDHNFFILHSHIPSSPTLRQSQYGSFH